ncbi:unnamed protein product, partial [Polarella glacialis]
ENWNGKRVLFCRPSHRMMDWLAKHAIMLEDTRHGLKHDVCRAVVGNKQTQAQPNHSSTLLDQWAAKGLLDVAQRHSPVHLAEHFTHVVLLGHKESAHAARHRLEKLNGQAAGAHLSYKPHSSTS